jgi:translocation and assembly module TamA
VIRRPSPCGYERRGSVSICAFLVMACLLATATGARAEGVAYATRLTGLPDQTLRKDLLNVSRLKKLENQPAGSLGALRRRAESDLDTFSRLLRSEGYYDYAMRYRFDTGSTPLKVRVHVDPGPRYRLAAFDVVLRGDELEPAMSAVDRARKVLVPGQPGQTKIIMDAENAVLRELTLSGFPFPKMNDREVVVDHADRTITVRTLIDTGRRARFGPTDVPQEKRGSLAEYARRRIPWKEGEPYDPRLLEKGTARLMDTRLFSGIRITPVDGVAENGTLPMVLDFDLAKMRSIGLGVGYSSDEGAGAQAFWENRNLFGHAERLRISGRVTQIGETGKLTFRRPDFFAVDQDLVFETSYDVEKTPAYDSYIFATTLGLERAFAEHWRARGGIGVRVGPVDESRLENGRPATLDRHILLVGLPLGLGRDTSNSILDPTSGTKLDASLTPYMNWLGSDLSFVVGKIGETSYLPVLPDHRLVLAQRAAIGSISGANADSVPADRRFYAGGGGSVRGFAYQMAGPLDSRDDPLGGRSLIEMSGEIRWRITKSFGLVPFVDAGSVFPDPYPNFNRMFLGAGLGLRYFSPVGPVRIDVATPLNPRSSDDPVQFYISLGQAY